MICLKSPRGPIRNVPPLPDDDLMHFLIKTCNESPDNAILIAKDTLKQYMGDIERKDYNRSIAYWLKTQNMPYKARSEKDNIRFWKVK